MPLTPKPQAVAHLLKPKPKKAVAHVDLPLKPKPQAVATAVPPPARNRSRSWPVAKPKEEKGLTPEEYMAIEARAVEIVKSHLARKPEGTLVNHLQIELKWGQGELSGLGALSTFMRGHPKAFRIKGDLAFAVEDDEMQIKERTTSTKCPHKG